MAAAGPATDRVLLDISAATDPGAMTAPAPLSRSWAPGHPKFYAAPLPALACLTQNVQLRNPTEVKGKMKSGTTAPSMHALSIKCTLAVGNEGL